MIVDSSGYKEIAMIIPCYIRCLPLASLALLGNAQAYGNDAGVSVSGSIAPSACQINLNDGGLLDFGRITSDQLAPGDEYTLLPVRKVILSIQCPAPISVAVRVYATRSWSGDPGLSAALGAAGHRTHQLQHANKAIGAYTLRLDHSAQLADGKVVVARNRQPPLDWVDTGDLPLTVNALGVYHNGWGELPGVQRYRSIRSTMTLQVALNKRSLLPTLQQPLSIEGRTALRLIYL